LLAGTKAYRMAAVVVVAMRDFASRDQRKCLPDNRVRESTAQWDGVAPAARTRG
jgi:hypothetical protein